MTRGIEIKNNLTVTRGEVGKNNQGKGEKGFQDNYKGYMNKTKGRWKQGEEVGIAGFGEEWWGKMQTTVIEQQ